METSKNELKLYYNSDKKHDRETLGYAESLDVAINEQDLSKSNLTERQFAQLADNMNIPISDLADKNSDYFLAEIKDKEFSDEEMLKLLNAHPELVHTPIALIGEHTYFVKSPFELVNKDLDIEGIQTNKGEASESNNNEV